MRSKRLLRLLCACLISVISISLLTGCKSRELSPDRLSKKVVGTVAGNTVYYDELYTLANLTYEEGMTQEELWNAVCGKLFENYSKLELCERYGVEYDEDELKDDVQTSIDSMINESFGGERDAYIDALDGMSTDRYTRFNIEIELLYSQLPNALAASGEMSADEDEVIEYIKNNFVRTKHFMVANSDGEDKDENLLKAQNALTALRSKKTTLNSLIGGKYKVDGKTLINDDLLIPMDGYTFGKGTMDESYEKAAYSLEVGEFSEVITANGEDPYTGKSVECYYVIERLPLTEDFIKANYASLYETYSNVIVQQKLTQTVSDMSFKPNDFANSLNILDLDAVKVGTDVTLIVIICSIATATLALTAVIVLLVIRSRKKKLILASGKALPKKK